LPVILSMGETADECIKDPCGNCPESLFDCEAIVTIGYGNSEQHGCDVEPNERAYQNGECNKWARVEESHYLRCCRDNAPDSTSTVTWKKTDGCGDLWHASFHGSLHEGTSSCEAIHNDCFGFCPDDSEQWNGISFANAVVHCESVGGRLCARAEVESGCVSTSGCGINRLLMWTSETREVDCARVENGSHVRDSCGNCCLEEDKDVYGNCPGASNCGAVVTQGRPNGPNCWEVDACKTKVVQLTDTALYGLICCADYEEGQTESPVAGLIEPSNWDQVTCKTRVWSKAFHGPKRETPITNNLPKSQNCDNSSHGVTFDFGKKKCEDMGARLCTKDEIQSGCVTGSGCYANWMAVWTSDREEVNQEE